MSALARPQSAVASAGATVEIVSVTPFPGAPSGAGLGTPNDINDAGTIVGSTFNSVARTPNALRWTVGGGAPVILGHWEFGAGANAISQDGNTIVGFWGLVDLTRLADPAIVRETGGHIRLGPCCIQPGQALGVNDVGQIVGYHLVLPTGPGVAERDLPALWSGGTTVDLLNGQSSGRAYDINNAGVAIGQRTEGPFRWQSGTVTPLPTLGGAATTPLSINESNVIAGVSGTTAVRWVNGAISALAGVPGTNSRANDINDFGEIAGTYVDPISNTSHAFFWSEASGFLDLGTGSARALNNRGAIAGNATTGAAVVWILNFGPVASLSGPDEAKKNESLTFSATASTDRNLDALTYAWDFGDGSTGTGATVTHAYKKQDTYTVTVTVSDPRGLTSTASLEVSVENGKKPKKEHDNNGNGPKKP